MIITLKLMIARAHLRMRLSETECAWLVDVNWAVSSSSGANDDPIVQMTRL